MSGSIREENTKESLFRETSDFRVTGLETRDLLHSFIVGRASVTSVVRELPTLTRCSTVSISSPDYSHKVS